MPIAEEMSPEGEALLKGLAEDFELYAGKALMIRSKAGPLQAFRLNRAQGYVHARLEAQRTAMGKVRALVLKGRQQGVSTLIAGRFFWRTTHERGARAFILTHEQAATDTIFAIAQRFHDHAPPILRRHTGAANAKTLEFDQLDSGFEVGTAGTRAVGRSKTLQLFHGSEVAFWPHAASHFSAVIQAVPELAGTEVILESTANGLGGEFHERWQRAEAGIGDYQAIFVPWFWQDEYRRPAAGLVMDGEEEAYARAHGLEPAQIAWRRGKIAELKDEAVFRQEYPATAAEAFQTTGRDSFISPQAVLLARKSTVEGIGPLVGGADPARFGDDRFSVAWRRGRKVETVESRTGLSVVEGAAWLKQEIDVRKPARLFVDLGGIGAGVVDVLASWGLPYSAVVTGVNFGGAPMEPVEVLASGERRPGPRNRRAEMWKRSKDWLDDPAGVDLPDLDSLQADACGPGYSYDINQSLLLEAKERMKARGLRSPDEWDAVALTFAEPVHEVRERPVRRDRPYYTDSWMA